MASTHPQEPVAVEPAGKSLSQQTVSGLNWQVVANVVKFGAQFGIGIALARLLLPEDFGIVSLAYIVTGFAATLADLGLGPALVQREALTERHVRVCQTLSLGMSVVITVVLFIAAGPIATFFEDARVAPVLRVLAFTFLFTGLGVTSRALLRRRFDFRSTVKIELLASIIGYGGIAVGMAVAGFGYWSLVGGTMAQTVLASLLMYRAARHPLRPLLAHGEIRDLFGFSAGVSLEGIISYFARQGDYFVVGRVMGVASLGFYSRAYALMQLPQTFLGTALARVLFPAASRVQDDLERFRRAYLTTFSLSIALSLPISLGMTILAPELILTLYGEAWSQTIPLLQILSLFGSFRMSYNNVTAFIKAQGRAFSLVVSQLIYAIAVVGGSWWAISLWGLEGGAWAVGVAIFMMWSLVVGIANRVAGVPVGQFARVFSRAILPGLLLGLILFGVRAGLHAIHLSSSLVLVLGGGLFSIATIGVLFYQGRRMDHPAINAQLDRAVAYMRAHFNRFLPSFTAP